MAARIEKRGMDLHPDARGWVVNPFEHLPAEAVPNHCHIISIEPGHARGRHLHPGRDEHFIALSGEIHVVEMDCGSVTVISGAHPELLVIPRGVPHVFENRGSTTAVAICFSAGASDPAPEDTVRL
jgi:mannose-6-phosphate isomerase-like protein (cupin superfamily)